MIPLMTIDPDDIRLSRKHREQLAELAAETGRDWPELFDAMIKALFDRLSRHSQSHPPAIFDEDQQLEPLSLPKPDPSVLAAKKQSKALKSLHHRLDTLPDRSVNDGLCPSRDHDRILYGES